MDDGPYDELERLVIDFSHELTTTARVTDETWQRLTEHLDVPQMVELTFVVAMWNMTNRLNNAFRTQLEPDQADALKLLFGETSG